MTIGERIKELRTAKDWTQEQLAQECGLSRNSIYKYERNEVMPRGPQQKRIAAALGVSPIYLLYGQTPAERAGAVFGSNDPGDEEAIAALQTERNNISLEGLTDEQRTALRVIVDSMKKEG